MPYKWTNALLLQKLMNRFGLRMPELGAPSPVLSETIVPVVSMDDLTTTYKVVNGSFSAYRATSVGWCGTANDTGFLVVPSNKRWILRALTVTLAIAQIEALGYNESSGSTAEKQVLKSQAAAVTIAWESTNGLALPAGTQILIKVGAVLSEAATYIATYDEIDVAGI